MQITNQTRRLMRKWLKPDAYVNNARRQIIVYTEALSTRSTRKGWHKYCKEQRKACRQTIRDEIARRSAIETEICEDMS